MVSYNGNDRYAVAKARMIHEHLAKRDIRDERVLSAMERVPREEFVPETYGAEAYADRPLPIGKGQTISQPYIVALMTQALDPRPGDEVLEIGTGCGYQAAILAVLVKRLYTIERFNELAESAQTHLANLDIHNVDFYIGDGSSGWPEARQFDKIIVTCAVPEAPAPLLEQLKTGGKLVAPVGGEMSQNITICEKTETGLHTRSICPCRFVKLIGQYGFSE